MERPVIGQAYFAPTAHCSATPLVFGERRGIVVDEPSQSVAVVYSTREAAEAALRDRAVWAEGNAARVRVARIVYRGLGTPRFAWADDDEREAHRDAVEFAYCARCAAPHLSVDACERCNHVCSARCPQRVIAKRERDAARLPYGGAKHVTRVAAVTL